MKTILIAFTTALVFATAAWAQGADVSQAQQMAQQTAQKITRLINQNPEKYKKNPDALYDLANKVVLPHFDFRYMAQIALGRYWRQASEDQRERFTQAFKSLLVRTYADSLLKYRNNKITWKPVHAAQGADHVTIRSEVELQHGSPVPIDYSAILEDKEWQVYDVAVDGISLVTNYRSSFAAQVQQNGIDALIERVKKKAETQAEQNQRNGL